MLRDGTLRWVGRRGNGVVVGRWGGCHPRTSLMALLCDVVVEMWKVELTKYGILKYCVTFKQAAHGPWSSTKLKVHKLLFFTSPSPSLSHHHHYTAISTCLTRHVHSYYKLRLSQCVYLTLPPLLRPSRCIHRHMDVRRRRVSRSNESGSRWVFRSFFKSTIVWFLMGCMYSRYHHMKNGPKQRQMMRRLGPSEWVFFI
jgi:hypothetical protein